MTDEVKRKMSKKSFGKYKLLSVKDPGCSWSGCIWTTAKTLKEFDEMSDEERERSCLSSGCPNHVPGICFPTEYPYVRSECKMVSSDDFRGEDGNCAFLFRYANSASYNCRLRVKSAEERIYED